MSLAEMYEKIASMDYEAEEQYEELNDVEKTAQEYDAAGRIMARGFMDELDKLAAASGPTPGVMGMAQQAKAKQVARNPAPARQYTPAKPKSGTVSMGPPTITR